MITFNVLLTIDGATVVLNRERTWNAALVRMRESVSELIRYGAPIDYANCMSRVHKDEDGKSHIFGIFEWTADSGEVLRYIVERSE